MIYNSLIVNIGSSYYPPFKNSNKSLVFIKRYNRLRVTG